MDWTCKDGRVLDIKEMETSHLQNAINMLRRKGYVTLYDYLSCSAYAQSANTPDGAAMAAEGELMGMIPTRSLDVMEAELSKRHNESK